jgi:uncharacterized protein YndB with AHSA1/START domain
MRLTRLAGTLLVLPLAAALTGCAGGLGGLEDILGGAMGGGQSGPVRAEVQGINQSNQTIQVRTESGETGAVRYDDRTQVVYQQQQYPVTALERGDLIVMQLQQSSSGETYVGRIDVEQSVRERGGQGGTGQVQLIEGQVGQVDQTQGAFQLRTQGITVVVTLPYNPPSQTLDRFHRLRSGEYVAIEGTWISENRVELSRFR